MKGARRKARKDSLMILYQLELNKDVSPQTAIQYFKDNYTLPEKSFDEFTQRLVQGVIEHSSQIAEILQKTSSHWKTERMATVDRNVLRLGVFELCFCDDIPATVTINEMIEIAKEFSSEKSASFINGILDKVRLEKPSSRQGTLEKMAKTEKNKAPSLEEKMDCLWLVLENKRGDLTFSSPFLRDLDWKTRGFLSRIVRERTESKQKKTIFVATEKKLGASLCALDTADSFNADHFRENVEGLKAKKVAFVFESKEVRESIHSKISEAAINRLIPECVFYEDQA